MNTGSLKPRAVAALCALRSGPRTTISIRKAIGDKRCSSTHDLMTDLRRDLGYVELAGGGFWHLTYEGCNWCEREGLPVSHDARKVACDPRRASEVAGGGQ